MNTASLRSALIPLNVTLVIFLYPNSSTSTYAPISEKSAVTTLVLPTELRQQEAVVGNY